MSKQVFSDALIAFDGHAMTCTTNQCAVNYGVNTNDGTTFCDDTTINEPGLLTATMSAQGFFDAPIDKGLHETIGDRDKVMTIATGSDAGSVAYALNSVATEYNPSASIGDLLGSSLTAGARDRLLRGKLLLHAEGLTASGTSNGISLPTVGTDKALYAALHITKAGGSPSIDVAIENGGGTSLLTFDTANQAGSQFMSVPGSLSGSSFKVNYTISGSNPDVDLIVVAGVLPK